MKTRSSLLWLCLLALVLWTCGKKDPDPQLPAYLSVPGNLTGYKGSGLIEIQGELTLRAEGAEKAQSNGIYSGVLGETIGADFVLIQATFSQPLPYKDRSTVPAANRSYGVLQLMNIYGVGTFPMGYDAQPTPKGEIADLSLNMPGPRAYITKLGQLTIDERTVVRRQEDKALLRIRGSFNAKLLASGTGVTELEPQVTGTFDVLLVGEN